MGTTNRKRSKAQEATRLTLLQPILNKFCYVKLTNGSEESFYFVYHRLVNPNSTSKLEQIILSGNLLYDGLYTIGNYELDRVWDVKNKKFITELYQYNYDLDIGQEGFKATTKTKQELMQHLVKGKYITEEEFWYYCQSLSKPDDMEEIRLIFEPNRKSKGGKHEDI